MNKNAKRLTNSEQQIMEVLWKSNKPLSSHGVVESSPNRTWKESSVHLLLNSLLNKGLIEMAGFEKRTKNYARTFAPSLSYVDYVLEILSGSDSDKELRAELLVKLVKQENDKEILDDVLRVIQKKI